MPGIPIFRIRWRRYCSKNSSPCSILRSPFLLAQTTSRPSRARSTTRCRTVTHTSQVIHAQSPLRLLPSPIRFASSCSRNAASSVVICTRACSIFFLHFRFRTSRSGPPLVSSNSSLSSPPSSPSLTGLNVISPSQSPLSAAPGGPAMLP